MMNQVPMKLVSITMLLLLHSFQSRGQENPQYQFGKGAQFLNAGLLGSSGMLGVGYSRKMTDALSLEAYVGVFTYGGSFKFHLPDTQKGHGWYAGFSAMNSYTGQWITYLPIGISFNSKKRIHYSLDIGPAMAEGVDEGDSNYALPWLGFYMNYALPYRAGQVEPKEWNAAQKNHVYVTASVYTEMPDLDAYERTTLNYERILLEREQKTLNTAWLRVGAGIEKDGPFLLLAQIVGLNGRGILHFEYGLGIAALVEERTYTVVDLVTVPGEEITSEETSVEAEIWPALNLGQRFQKQDGLFILRYGIAIPEGLYVGLGVAF